jgi:hypothetical protein
MSTLYVSPAGSDFNTGLTPADPLQSVQTAIDKAILACDAVTISLAAGTYNGALSLSTVQRINAVYPISIIGDEMAPSNVVLASPTSCLSVYHSGVILVSGVKFTATGAGSACVSAAYHGKVFLGNVIFGPSAGDHVVAQFGGHVRHFSNYAIQGAVVGSHWHALDTGTIMAEGVQAALSGFSYGVRFAGANFGKIRVTGWSYTGPNCTGVRWLSHRNGIIDTSVANYSMFPGSLNGNTTANAGGLYL